MKNILKIIGVMLWNTVAAITVVLSAFIVLFYLAGSAKVLTIIVGVFVMSLIVVNKAFILAKNATFLFAEDLPCVEIAISIYAIWLIVGDTEAHWKVEVYWTFVAIFTVRIIDAIIIARSKLPSAILKSSTD